jgi:putative endonuclease
MYYGYTHDLIGRFAQHTKGQVLSTKNRRPLVLVYYEACRNKDDAMNREKYFKTYHGRIFIKRRLKSYFTGSPQ